MADDIVIGLIAEDFDRKSGRHGLIFDGFPRDARPGRRTRGADGLQGQVRNAMIKMHIKTMS